MTPPPAAAGPTAAGPAAAPARGGARRAPRITHPKDFWSGALFLAFAAYFAASALGHNVGTAFRMGPAYFPLLLAAILAAIGAAVLLRGFAHGGEAPTGVRPGAVAFVAGGVVLFGLTIRGLGLLGAVPLLVLASAAASRRARPLQAVLLAIGLAGFAALVFVRLLGLPIPVVGRWLGGY